MKIHSQKILLSPQSCTPTHCCVQSPYSQSLSSNLPSQPALEPRLWLSRACSRASVGPVASVPECECVRPHTEPVEEKSSVLIKICMNAMLPNSLEGNPSTKQATQPRTVGWRVPTRGSPAGPPLPPRSPQLPRQPGGLTAYPQPSPTRPSSPRRTTALLIQALVGMCRGWGRLLALELFEDRALRQPGELKALRPARNPWKKTPPGFLCSRAGLRPATSRPDVAGLGWAGRGRLGPNCLKEGTLGPVDGLSPRPSYIHANSS